MLHSQAIFLLFCMYLCSVPLCVLQDRGVKAVLDKARGLMRDSAGSLDSSRTMDSLAMTESSIKKVHVGGSGKSL